MNAKPPPTPVRIGYWGLLIQANGALVAVLGLGIFIIALETDHGSAILTGALLLGSGLYSFFLGKRLASPPARELLQRDTRAPVVFVRSFRDEHYEYSLKGYFQAIWTQMKMQSAGTLPMSSPWGPTLQWQLAALFKEVGPYVAIGKPGEKLTALGAARMYVADDEWKAVISDLFHKARLIVLQVGSTPGLNWELNEIRQHIEPKRVLFILPHREQDYQLFRAWMNPRLPQPLPDTLPATRFMTLDADWTPRVIPMNNMLYDTLENYLAQNGVQRTHISWWYRIVYNSSFFNGFVAIGLFLAAIWLASLLQWV